MVKGLTEFITKYHIQTRIVDREEYLVMYKAVCLNFGSWYRYKTCQTNDVGAYKPGTTVDCRKWSANRRNDCGVGLHVGTWTFAESFIQLDCDKMPMLLIEVLVRPEDVVCVPYISIGKIRCKRLVVTKVIKRA